MDSTWHDLLNSVQDFEHTVIQDRAVLVHGDCLKVLPHFPSQSVKLIVTDPPYGKAYRTNHRKEQSLQIVKSLADDSRFPAITLREIVRQAVRFLSSHGAIYAFSDLDLTHKWEDVLPKPFEFGQTLIWIKNNWTAGNLKDYARRTEGIIYARRKMHQLNGSRDHNVLYFPRVASSKMIHPTEKPIGILQYLITKSSLEGNVVLDPFAGSGSTVEAALHLGRKAIGIELDREFYEAGVRRLRQLIFSFPEAEGALSALPDTLARE